MGRHGAGVLGLALVAACSVYDASLIVEGNAGVPSRPASGTSSPDDAQTLVFGLKDVFIRQSAEMAARTGIDLDLTVTNWDNSEGNHIYFNRRASGIFADGFESGDTGHWSGVMR